MRVLVVDDSVVFRSQIRAALETEKFVESVAAANNGKIALQKLSQNSFDLVTVDMEMPELSGIETIREIRKAKFPVRIIVFSSHTRSGSAAALEALNAGADDFAAKPSGDDVNVSNSVEKIREQLIPKVMQFVPGMEGLAPAPLAKPATAVEASPQKYERRDISTFNPSVIVIGSSTGGPPVLEKILANLPSPTRIPILIAQHMPPIFTASLSVRLTTVTGIPASEAEHGKPIKPGRIYIAPGDFHFTVRKAGEEVIAHLDKGPQRNSVRPCVDTLFESVVHVYAGRTFGLILTGMGEDGMLGCRAIKKAGGGVVIQSKDSCVVFGMPGAVYRDGCFDEMYDLQRINTTLINMLR